MNPNANSFNFSAGAGSFVPRGAPGQGQQGQQYQGYDQYSQQQGQPYGAPGGAGYYQQYQGQQPYDQGAGGQGNYYQQYNQQQQYYGGYNQQYQPQQPQQGAYRAPHQRNNAPPSVQAPIVPASQSPSHNLDSSASAAGVQDNWDDEDPVAPAPTPAASKPAPQGKTISLGAPKPAAAETPKASSISISIGGKKVQEPKAEEQKPKEAAAAPAASISSAAKPAASASPAKTTPSATPAPAAASSAAKKTAPAAASASKQADKEAGPTAGSVKTADEIADQIASAAAEDELKDLFGVSADGKIDGKEHINVVFIGHVDAGKSTMGGQILVQSGMVDKRTLEKYEKDAKEVGRDSWYLSYALDSTPQERNQGKTVEVGRAYFETEKRRYTILDAPGHKSFVPAMISGAAQADVAILVISARKGEFEAGFDKGGQTREHIVLVKTAGVSRLVIAINKMDEPTVQWDKARYDEIVGKLTPFLKGTGYNPKTDVTIMPVSGQTGLGIKDRIDTKICPWYNGPSLLEHLDTMAMANRNLNAPFMMPISEKYKDMGTIVVGKIESGRVKRGDTVTIMPNKNQVEITAIYAESEEEVPYAMCGDNVRFRLRGIDDEDISIGYVVSDAKKPVHAVQLFEAQLIILEHKNIICAGYSAVMHVHTAAEEITLSALLHYYDKKTGRKSKRPPQFAKKGQKIIALVEAAGPVCIEKYDDYQQLGRFTLRDEGRTIAIGKVTKLIEKSDDMPNVAGMNLGGIAGQVAASAPSNGA